MILNRREFLASTLAGVGGAVLVRSGFAADEKAAATAPAAGPPVNPYELVPLGKTGLKVSRISCGTGMRGSMRQSNQTRMGEEKFGRSSRTSTTAAAGSSTWPTCTAPCPSSAGP